MEDRGGDTVRLGTYGSAPRAGWTPLWGRPFAAPDKITGVPRVTGHGTQDGHPSSIQHVRRRLVTLCESKRSRVLGTQGGQASWRRGAWRGATPVRGPQARGTRNHEVDGCRQNREGLDGKLMRRRRDQSRGTRDGRPHAPDWPHRALPVGGGCLGGASDGQGN